MTTLALPRRILAPLVQAATWDGVWSAMRAAVQRRAGKDAAPWLTNGEAVTVVRVWRGVSTSDGPLWHQFAARAYGWNPPTRKTLVRTARQMNARYPAESTRDVWEWSHGIARELDARGDQPPPSLAPNFNTFADPVFQGEVLSELSKDGYVTTFAKRAPVSTPAKFPPLVLMLGAWWLLTRKRRQRRT